MRYCLTPREWAQLHSVHWKLAQSRRDELETVRGTGRVPLNLFSLLLLWRSAVTFESKSMEGARVVLQALFQALPLLAVAARCVIGLVHRLVVVLDVRAVRGEALRISKMRLGVENLGRLRG